MWSFKMKEKLVNLHLKAYHFCLLFIILTSALYIIDFRRITMHIDNVQVPLDEINDISLIDTISSDVCFVLVHCHEHFTQGEMEHNLSDIMHQENCFAKCYKINANNLRGCSSICESSIPYTLIFKGGKKLGHISGIVSTSSLMHIYSSAVK